MSRRPAAWALLVALAAALTLIPAGPAHAFPLGGCKEAPVATVPSQSGPALLGAHAALEATGADPFAVGATTTVYQEYGWPTTWWPIYDLGCGPDIARNPGAVVGGFVAETSTFGGVAFASMFDGMVHAVLDWQGLAEVDAAIGGIVDDLREQMWLPLVTIVLLLTAAWFVIKVIRGDVGDALKAAGSTLLASLALVILINYPVKSAQVFDSTVKGSIAAAYTGAVPGADSGAEIADGLISRTFQATMYDRWCEGMVGGDPAAGQRWCPALWKSLYVSRHEQRTTRAQDRAALLERKADQFEEIAEQVKDQDPAAYSVLTGRDYQTRLFAVGFSNLIWPLVAVFPLASLFLLLVALMMVRVAVMLAPVIGPILVHPAARHMCRSGLHVVGAALLNAVWFGIASALFLRVEIAVLSATTMPVVVRLVVLAVLTAAFWLIFKPWLHLTRMRPRKAGETAAPSKTLQLLHTISRHRGSDNKAGTR